jgi:hypothetical protein
MFGYLLSLMMIHRLSNVLSSFVHLSSNIYIYNFLTGMFLSPTMPLERKAKAQARVAFIGRRQVDHF